MEIGKISESVLKRTVLKQIKNKNEQVKNGAGVGSDCAIFACSQGFALQSVQTAAIGDVAEIPYVIHRAVNNLAVAGGTPVIISLAFILPPDVEESWLKAAMEKADATAGLLGVQIAGGHTQVVMGAAEPFVTVAAAGSATKDYIKTGAAKPGQDIVVSKWIALEGTALLARRYGEKLAERYPLHLIEQAADFDKMLSVLAEAAGAVKSNVGAMHDVSTGGIFAALWELAESAGVGLAIDLKKIPIRQESVEVCEYFGISPYELLSGGCLLMTADNGEDLVQALETADIPATVIGKITDNNDRVVINEEERRFLERPKSDSIYKI